MTESIQQVLRQLGIGANYKGFRITVLAISLIVENEDRLTSITKDIYYDVAKLTGYRWTAVERNIRTVVARAWYCNPQKLNQIAGYTLTSAPIASEFLDIVSNYVRRNPMPGSAQRNWPGR